MTSFTWNHACSIGVKAMDDQHGVLMDALSDLRVALVHGQGREQVGGDLARLIEYTRLHFACEERLLEQHGFPAINEHRAAHLLLLQEIEEAALRLQRKDGLLITSTLSFLRSWHIRHVEELDSQYGAWLNERGIA